MAILLINQSCLLANIKPLLENQTCLQVKKFCLRVQLSLWFNCTQWAGPTLMGERRIFIGEFDPNTSMV